MNLLVNSGLNQMKDQAQALMPSEMEDKGDKKGGQENGGKAEVQVKKQPKSKKRNPISKASAIKMYTVLMIHTIIVTLVLMNGLYSKRRNQTVFTNDILNLIIFAACFVGGTFFSFIVTNFRFLSKIINFLIYIILLGANVAGFYCLLSYGEDVELIPKILITMFIVFDSGSIMVIVFSLCVKDTPSTFWIMLSSAGGNLLAIVIMLKVYNFDAMLKRYCLMGFAFIAFAIFEVMNYHALDVYRRSTTNQTKIPSMFALPFELNNCYVKTFWYLLLGIAQGCGLCCSACCSRRK